MTHQVRTLTFLSPDEVKANPKNPRKHARAQIRALAKSIESFGFNAPILIDRGKMIIAGHGRLEAAKLLKLARIPVIALDDLNEAQAKAYMLADNKLTDRSSWDDPLLAQHLKELSELSVDFDIDATGFQMPEIDLRILSLDEEEMDAADNFEMSNEAPVTRVGDVWLLADHLLCCGSSLKAETYAGFPPEITAKAIFADPPYNVRVNGHVSGLGKIKHREFSQASGEMTEEEFQIFLVQAIKLASQRCADGAVEFWCMDWRHIAEMHTAGLKNGLELINLCVWAKTNGGMGTFYRSRHELVFVFKKGGEAYRNNVQLGCFGRNRTNVWHYPGANVPSSDKTLRYHPTPKPIALVADALLDCTVKGDFVLDPFLGSGTSLLAAERTGRRCLGIELDPLYVDTAINRWERASGATARLANGQSFAEVKAARAAI